MPEHTPAPTFSRAVYGFVLHLTFKTIFILYVVWAVVPDSVFKYVNFTYLPQKYWAVTIPILFLVFLSMFAFVIYPCLNLCMTPNPNDMRTITDKCAKINKNSCKHSDKSALKKISEKSVKINTNYCSCKKAELCFKDVYSDREQLDYLNNKQLNNYCVPPVEDISISDVCKTLYKK